jgi:hypothetical protein
MKESKFDHLYLCVGICQIPPIAGRIGDCGVTHTLREWLDLLYPGKNAVEFFSGDDEKSIIDYLLNNADHRLVRE